MPVVTIGPKAYRLFKALDGREFATNAEFADAFESTYAELFRGSPWQGDSADVLTWGQEAGVILRKGSGLIITVKGPPPAY